MIWEEEVLCRHILLISGNVNDNEKDRINRKIPQGICLEVFLK